MNKELEQQFSVEKVGKIREHPHHGKVFEQKRVYFRNFQWQ